MKSRRELMEQLIPLLPHGNYITLVGMNGSGKGDFIRKLLLDNHLAHPKNRIILIRASSLLEVSIQSFYNLLIETLQDELNIEAEETTESLQQKDLYKLTKVAGRILSEYLRDPDSSVTIILTNIDRYKELGDRFYISLRSLREQNIFRIGYIFTGKTDLLNVLTPEIVGNFYEVLTSKIVRLEVGDKDLFEEVVEVTCKSFDFKLNNDQKSEIFRLTRGHPSLTKYVIQYLSENGAGNVEDYIEYPPLRTRLESLTKEMDRDLLQYYRSTELADFDPLDMYTKSLLSAGFIQKDQDGVYIDSIPLLREFVNANVPTSEMSVANRMPATQSVIAQQPADQIPYTKDGNVYLGSQILGDDLSEREFELLSMFVDNYGKVVNRDSVAEVLWKSRSIEKYSDWAIDQTISRLRKKLPQTISIKTIKGRGFKLGRT